MTRAIAICVPLMLAACAAAEPRIVSETPASVELECIGAFVSSCRSPQAVADAAQAHCQKYGLNAQENMLSRAPSGNERAVFNCVAPGTAAAAGVQGKR
jgi:hypothetical protein